MRVAIFIDRHDNKSFRVQNGLKTGWEMLLIVVGIDSEYVLD